MTIRWSKKNSPGEKKDWQKKRMREIEKEKEKQNLFIQLLGVPASGKTTCAKYLGERLGFQVLEEYPVSDNSLFEKYYSEPDKWAFSIWQNAFYAQARLERKPQELAWYNGKQRAENDPARKTELQESENYWRRLWELHEEWVAGNPLGLNIFILDMDKYDISNYFNREQQLGAVFEELSKKVKFS